jgi:hypothetical protein
MEKTGEEAPRNGQLHYFIGRNNATERLICLYYKIMAKTARGFKSWLKALNYCYLSDYLRGEDGVCDLRKAI